MSGEKQWKRKEIESIPEYWSEISRRSPGKRESLHLFFRNTLVPFIWFLRRLFASFDDGRTRRRRFRLPCTFPPLRFICWTIIGIGAFYCFLSFLGTLRFGYSFLLACTDFFIFFTRTLSFARINIVTMFRNKPGKGDSFLISVSLSQLSRNLSVVVFVDKTNSNIALRVCRHFVLRQFVKDAWLWAWVIHAEHIRAMWLAAV